MLQNFWIIKEKLDHRHRPKNKQNCCTLKVCLIENYYQTVYLKLNSDLVYNKNIPACT